ncbi:DUF4230 domain-containing protein [Patescibacteria group bacterium]|nr:DUF4230 domain-containing protein [Patescibacteria group bacterium]MBU1921735.1 DUF4230 domain-containing protein [Patescibacteria group bacterium]
MKKFGQYLIAIVLIFAAGLVLGWYVTRDVSTKNVSSQVILTALHDRGFLVTQTYIFNEPIEIRDQDESFWSKILWGQVIKAHGVVEVNLGVDLSEISQDDVEVDSNKIRVYVSRAEIFNSRLVGEVSVENSQGILKSLFESDDGYNQAMAELTRQAENAALSNEMIQVANQKSQDEISRLVGYIAEGKEVEIKIRGSAIDID